MCPNDKSQPPASGQGSAGVVALLCVYTDTASSWQVVGAQQHSRASVWALCACIAIAVCQWHLCGLETWLGPVDTQGRLTTSSMAMRLGALGRAVCAACRQHSAPPAASVAVLDLVSNLAIAPGLRIKHTAAPTLAARMAAYACLTPLCVALCVRSKHSMAAAQGAYTSKHRAAGTLQQAHCTACCCRYFCDVWTYDTDSMQWACHSKGDGPSPRGGHQLALHSDSLFAFGGHTAWMEDGQEREKVHDEVWKLDLKTYQVNGCTLQPAACSCQVALCNTTALRGHWQHEAAQQGCWTAGMVKHLRHHCWSAGGRMDSRLGAC